MTIDKAIEIQISIGEEGTQFTLTERRAAIKLGMEALKLVTELRQCFPSMCFGLLPGETE